MGQVDDGRWLNSGRPRVDDDVDPVADFLLNLERIRKRHIISGQGQGRTHERLPQALEHGMHERMVGNTQADGAPLWILQALGHLARGLQDESVRPGRHRPEQAVSPVVDPGIDTDLGQITANQCEIMLLVRPSNLPDSVHGALVADVAAQGVTRIRRICDQRALPDRPHD